MQSGDSSLRGLGYNPATYAPRPRYETGPYEIVAAIGAGGMSEVYRARDTRLDRTVAIKILPEGMSRDPLRKQRFEREAKTISSLNHPHICVLHDVGSQDGLGYLVMECLEGEILAKRLEKGPLPLEQALKYGAQIADALDKAHRCGVVHRDLKPGNIMLTPSGAKLLDFGLAKPAVTLATAATLTVTTPSSPVTEQGTIVGTFQYMSPEQVEGKELDGRSDIFSLGAVLYEMLMGKRAFEGKNQLSVASAILEKEPEPLSAVKPLVPSVLDHVIRKCLAKQPDERWQSASDLASELKWIFGSGNVEKVGPSGRAMTCYHVHFAGWFGRQLPLQQFASAIGSLVIHHLTGEDRIFEFWRAHRGVPRWSQARVCHKSRGRRGPSLGPCAERAHCAISRWNGRSVLPILVTRQPILGLVRGR